ncbi:hypothetical protein [Frankia sp. AvcI1]|uniref:hypothetical protein n=1 Tax=Frankia sp. AvcI1 TaxID=573496 RepID=UPI0005A4F61F|nr:hypothetical protein [Frankia sp. AvcI1]
MDEERDVEFRAYFASRLPALLRLAYLLTGNAADAEGVAQTALAREFAPGTVCGAVTPPTPTPGASSSTLAVAGSAAGGSARRRGPMCPTASLHPGGLAGVEDRVGLAAALAVLSTRQPAVRRRMITPSIPRAWSTTQATQLDQGSRGTDEAAARHVNWLGSAPALASSA